MSTKLNISPKTKVGELLDAYPHLEGLLVSLSPAFARLKNPVLRKTVAKVANLQQAAAIGGLSVEDMINKLREAVGQDSLGQAGADLSYNALPAWFSEDKISSRFDARPLIEGGGHPLGEVARLAKALGPGEILELLTPFVPAPLIEKLKEQGLEVFTREQDGVHSSFFCKPAE